MTIYKIKTDGIKFQILDLEVNDCIYDAAKNSVSTPSTLI